MNESLATKLMRELNAGRLRQYAEIVRSQEENSLNKLLEFLKVSFSDEFRRNTTIFILSVVGIGFFALVKTYAMRTVSVVDLRHPAGHHDSESQNGNEGIGGGDGEFDTQVVEAEEPTRVPTAEATQVVTPVVYVVRPGDNLFRIALDYSVDLQRLADFNDITLAFDGSYAFVEPGQQIKIPSPPELIRGYYIVQPGDTLYRISLWFGTTVDQLVEWNDLTDPNYLYPDQILQVRAFHQ